MTLSQGMKAKLIRDFRCIHCIGQILLVGKNKQHSIAEFVLWGLVTRATQAHKASATNASSQDVLSATSFASDRTHLVQHAVQLIPGFTDTIAVVAVHHKNQTLRVLEVVSPERSDLSSCVRPSVSSSWILISHTLPPNVAIALVSRFLFDSTERRRSVPCPDHRRPIR